MYYVRHRVFNTLMAGHYDTAQICKNGHVITSSYLKHPVHRQEFCQKCGEQTTTKCEACGTDIRGEYEVPGLIASGGGPDAPRYCHACGKPYPWTLTKQQAAKEYFEELEELDDTDKHILEATLDDLVQDTPKTEVASLRFKKVMKKIRKESYEAFKSVVTDLISETVKKTLFGS